MDSSGSMTFFTSSVIVTHNAIKNVIFRTATIILDFVILRFFGLIAFRRGDYTSFLMFAEDLIQKAWFVSSRGITARQSLLVGVFALTAAAGEFYDTMLWALDNPGYVMKHTMVNGAALSSQMADNPAYVVTVSAKTTRRTEVNLNSSFEINLYHPGFNFTLPGVFEEGTVEALPPVFPLIPATGTPRIQLDDEGFAVGVDFTFMSTPNMLRSLNTTCYPLNALNAAYMQVWDCDVPIGDASGMLDMSQGLVLVWWDAYHSDLLAPYGDNPWVAFGHGLGTGMMKQVFTITKGYRRHTFKQVVIKATMAAIGTTLADEEIADFMSRTWSTYGGITVGRHWELIGTVLDAKRNNTGRTFGELIQANTSVSAIYTDFLNFPETGGFNAVLRFTMVNITLIRSETLAEEPAPLQPCPGVVYSSYATGGIPSFTSCTTAGSQNQTLPLNQNRFLGQLDTSTVGVFTDFLGDGSSNVSAVAFNQTGIDWVAQQDGHIDSHLISRAMLMGGNASAVMVDVGTTVAAVSALQLFLCILPGILAIVIWWLTRDPALSYYQSSFLVAVLATTHTAPVQCEELGYIHSMPEITPQKRGSHMILDIPHEGEISQTVSIHRPMIYDPLILEGDRV